MKSCLKRAVGVAVVGAGLFVLSSSDPAAAVGLDSTTDASATVEADVDPTLHPTTESRPPDIATGRSHW